MVLTVDPVAVFHDVWLIASARLDFIAPQAGPFLLKPISGRALPTKDIPICLPAREALSTSARRCLAQGQGFGRIRQNGLAYSSQIFNTFLRFPTIYHQ
jgi:hypothetical protein